MKQGDQALLLLKIKFYNQIIFKLSTQHVGGNGVANIPYPPR